jgi:hypothetical protein
MKLAEKIAVASVATILFKVVFAGASWKIGGAEFDFGTIDALVIAAVLTPTLGAAHLGDFIAGKTSSRQAPNDKP